MLEFFETRRGNSTPNNRDFKTQWAETAKYVGGKENNSALQERKLIPMKVQKNAKRKLQKQQADCRA